MDKDYNGYNPNDYGCAQNMTNDAGNAMNETVKAPEQAIYGAFTQAEQGLNPWSNAVINPVCATQPEQMPYLQQEPAPVQELSAALDTAGPAVAPLPIYDRASIETYRAYAPQERIPIPVAGQPQEAKTTKTKKNHRFLKAVAACAVVAVVGAGTFTAGYSLNLRNSYQAIAEAEASALARIESAAGQKAQSLSTTLLSMETGSVAETYKAVSPAIVSINVKANVANIFNQLIETSGAGSGIIFAEDGDKLYIVTNYHVVSGATQATISLDDVVQVKASYVGGNESNDIAVISVAKTDLDAAGITNYKIASFADSDTVETGDAAIAIGNALGEGKSATLGIVSAVNKEIATDTRQILQVIQTDAAINAGNSGGALVNAKGQVIGINTIKYISSGVEGMGYAIPSNVVQEIIDGIMGQNKVETPYLGIEPRTITEQIKYNYNLPSLGVYINAVEAGGSAAESGLRQGDIITAVNGQTITTSEELSEKIADAKVGDAMALTIIRNGRSTAEVTVTLKNKGLNF